MRLHVSLDVGKARSREEMRDASDEGEEQETSYKGDEIQELQARELGCSRYPTYTRYSAATSATTSKQGTRNQSAVSHNQGSRY